MTAAQRRLENTILENGKMAIRQKRSKINHKNQQLLMMVLLQHQKLINASFLKIILLTAAKKSCYDHADDSVETIEILGITFGLLYRSKIQK